MTNSAAAIDTASDGTRGSGVGTGTGTGTGIAYLARVLKTPTLARIGQDLAQFAREDPDPDWTRPVLFVAATQRSRHPCDGIEWT